MNENISKKTKIVCTIGPASDRYEILRELLENGMNVVRLNFSHGSYEEHLEKIKTVRKLEKDEKVIIPIMLDTKGPEIRTHDFKNGQAAIQTGQIIEIYDHEILGDETKFSTTHAQLYDDVKVGNHIKLDDGNLDLVVIDKRSKDRVIIAKATNHHTIKNKRGINCPQCNLTMPYISEKDRNDLIFGCEQQIDLVAASFVRNLKDIQDIRKILDENGGKNIKIIIKVENVSAVKDFDELIKECDGAMVARGDLGVEVPPEDVPIIQRRIINVCRQYRKPVITATQMLDSMKTNPNPTRAEVSDVANAVMESTDSVMLSAETASGEYPIESVAMQAKISANMENFMYSKENVEQLKHLNYHSYAINDAIAASVSEAANSLEAKLIVSFSETGATAKLISSYRPCCPIIAVSSHLNVCRETALYWGVYPKKVKKVPQFIEEMEVYSLFLGRKYNLPDNSKIIITGGTPVGAGKTNFIKVIVLNQKDEDIDL